MPGERQGARPASRCAAGLPEDELIARCAGVRAGAGAPERRRSRGRSSCPTSSSTSSCSRRRAPRGAAVDEPSHVRHRVCHRHVTPFPARFGRCPRSPSRGRRRTRARSSAALAAVLRRAAALLRSGAAPRAASVDVSPLIAASHDAGGSRAAAPTVARRRRRGRGAAARPLPAAAGLADRRRDRARGRARAGAPTPTSSTSRRRSPTASRCSCPRAGRRRAVGGRAGGAAVAAAPGRPQHRDRRAARRAARRRPGDGAEDRRLPHGARAVHARSTTSTRSPASGRRGSRTCAGCVHRREPAPRTRAPARGRARASGSRSRTLGAAPRGRAVAVGRSRRLRRSRRRASPRRRLAGRCLLVAVSAGGGGARASTRSTAARSRPRSAARAAPSSSSPRRRRRAASRSARRAASRRFDGRAVDEPRAARAAARPLAAAGRDPRRARRGQAAARARARVRRAHLAAPPRRARRPAGRRVDADRPPRRARRPRRPAAATARAARSRPGLAGERRAVLEGIVLGDDSALSRRAAPGLPASGLYHLLAVSAARTSCWSRPACSCSRGCSASAAGSASSARSRRSARTCSRSAPQPSVIRAGIAGALASLAWLTGRLRDAWQALLLGARRAARLEPVPRLRPGLPALVRRGGGDLHARAADRARLEGYAAAAQAAARRRRLARRAASSRRRSCGSSSATCRCSACRRTRSPSRRCRCCSASRSSRPGSTPSRRPRPPLRRVAQRLGRRLHRALRAARSARCRSPRSSTSRGLAATRRRRSSPRPMLGGDGRRAEARLPARRHRPAEDRPRARAAARPVRARRGRDPLGGRADRRGRRRRVQRARPVRGRRPADRRRRRRGVEGARREGDRRLPEGAGARDDARARRRRAEEGCADREGGRGRPARCCSGTCRSAASRRWVGEQFKLHGAKAEPEACRTLVELVGDDLYELASEIDKLSTWAAGERVTADDVERLVARSRRGEQLRAHRRVGRARRRRRAARNRVDARAVGRPALEDDSAARSASSRSHVARIQECQALEASGVSAKDAAVRLKRHPYYVGKLYAQARNYSPDELRDVTVRLADSTTRSRAARGSRRSSSSNGRWSRSRGPARPPPEPELGAREEPRGLRLLARSGVAVERAAATRPGRST